MRADLMLHLARATGFLVVAGIVGATSGALAREPSLDEHVAAQGATEQVGSTATGEGSDRRPGKLRSTLPDAPIITYPPTPQVAILGGRAIFTVIARGHAELSYQWRKDGGSLSDGPGVAGATSDALILSDLGYADAADYGVVVSDAFGSRTSADASLVVRVPQGGDVDSSFDPGSSIDGEIMAAAAQPDGRVLIGGGFTAVNGAVRARIARLNADGTTDHTFANGLTGANDTVWCIAVQPDGRVLIGGYFTKVNGASRNGVARLNADGSLDPTFLALAGTNGGVHSIALQPDGRVLIGGYFTKVNGVSRHFIARLNTDGSLDTTFLDGLAGANDTVYALAVHPRGGVLVAGAFTTFNGMSRNCVARLTADGSLDPTFLDGLAGPNSIVLSLAMQPNGSVLIAGSFTTVDGASRGRIARLNADGSLDTSFLDGLAGANDIVLALASQLDGRVLIAGLFSAVGGVNRDRVARLNADGSLDTTFLDGLAGANGVVEALALAHDGRVLIGGGFDRVNGASRSRVARLDADGSLDPTFVNGIAGVNSVAGALALGPDGRVLIAGWFDRVNDVSRSHVARLDADGSLDPTFLNDLAGANHTVLALAVQPDGRVLIAGCFTTVHGVSRNGIARLNVDGSLDTTFLNGMPGANNPVVSLAVQPDGRVLIAGWFTAVNGVSRNHVARLNVDGSLDTTFLDGLAGTNAVVESLALQPDGRVLIGGPFTTVDGVSRSCLARLNADGSLDTAFLDGLAGANGVVRSIAVQPDGRALIGGDFTTVHGVGRSHLGRLNVDGSLDTMFLDGLAGPDDTVVSIVVQPDNRVLIGGYFTTIHGVSRSYVARLNIDGSLDTTFLDGLAGANNPVLSIALQFDGRVLMTGWFTAVNGASGNYIARLYGDVPVAP